MAIRYAQKPERPAEKIKEGLLEAIAVAKGEAEPHKIHYGVGRPPSGKKRLTLLVDPDVIEKFRATGKGWQARMNEALRKAAGL